MIYHSLINCMLLLFLNSSRVFSWSKTQKSSPPWHDQTIELPQHRTFLPAQKINSFACCGPTTRKAGNVWWKGNKGILGLESFAGSDMVGKMGTAQVGTNEVEYGIIRSYLAASNVRRLDNIYIYYTIYIYTYKIYQVFIVEKESQS